MDDKFLYQLREQPDKEFVKNLYERLFQNHLETERREPPHGLTLGKNLVWIPFLLILGFLIVTTISPVRAFVTSLLTQIAGLTFEITGDYPGDNDPGEVKIIEPQIMSLGEALAVFPYELHLPTNVPSGYLLNEENVRVYVGNAAGPFANTIELEWTSADRAKLSLRITDQDSEIIAPNSTEEILLNDQNPAVFIRGGWDADHKIWNENAGLRVRWLVDHLTYDLSGTDREQMIEMASSTLQ